MGDFCIFKLELSNQNDNPDIPSIPNNVLENVSNVYGEYHSILTDNDISNNISNNISKDLVITNYFMNHHREIVVILAGSNKDEDHVKKIMKYCDQLNLYTINYYSSDDIIICIMITRLLKKYFWCCTVVVTFFVWHWWQDNNAHDSNYQ